MGNSRGYTREGKLKRKMRLLRGGGEEGEKRRHKMRRKKSIIRVGGRGKAESQC